MAKIVIEIREITKKKMYEQALKKNMKIKEYVLWSTGLLSTEKGAL